MDNRRGQIIVVIFWVLLILAFLVFGISHRASLALRLSVYQKDGLKAYYLARAGVNLAIRELINDSTSSYDCLTDNWADNPDRFEKIFLDTNPDTYASVSYIRNAPAPQDRVYGVVDEESKININMVDQETLAALLDSIQIPGIESGGLAENILAWRDMHAIVSEAARDYKELGYTCKGTNFVVVEELLLVKGITPEIYLKLKNLITVFGEGKVNLNTAEPQTLEILINACVKKIQTPGGTPPPPPLDLLNGVLGYRQEHGFFTELDLGNLIDLLSLDQAVFARLVNEFKQLVVVRSQNFRIIATGRLDSKGRQRQIDCVYDRDNKKILFWHES